MKKILLRASLLMLACRALAGPDIWHTLFEAKLQEAGMGDSDAQYDVGSMYQNGRGVAPSRVQAIEWYHKAAAQNNTRAISRLQLMEANSARFEKTLSLAQKGNRASLHDLGHMYTMGIGTEIDPARAIDSYEQSANMGSAKSAYKLGLIYLEGTGVRQNDKAAFKWFSSAAESDLPAAQYYLGKLYAAGRGTHRDNRLALEWLRKAVDNGFDQARGEMINVMELLAQEATPADRTGHAQEPATRRRSPERAAKTAAGHFKLTDLMLGAWSRDKEPVAYLPSIISNCRTEDGRLICFSQEQTRQTATHSIRYRTKSIIDHFSGKGGFAVTYRHLVIDAAPLASSTPVSGDDGEPETYTVKTGWGSPHTLDCEFTGKNELSCLKNNTHAFQLVSSPALASGR